MTFISLDSSCIESSVSGSGSNNQKSSLEVCGNGVVQRNVFRYVYASQLQVFLLDWKVQDYR